MVIKGGNGSSKGRQQQVEVVASWHRHNVCIQSLPHAFVVGANTKECQLYPFCSTPFIISDSSQGEVDCQTEQVVYVIILDLLDSSLTTNMNYYRHELASHHNLLSSAVQRTSIRFTTTLPTPPLFTNNPLTTSPLSCRLQHYQPLLANRQHPPLADSVDTKHSIMLSKLWM